MQAFISAQPSSTYLPYTLDLDAAESTDSDLQQPDSKSHEEQLTPGFCCTSYRCNVALLLLTFLDLIEVDEDTEMPIVVCDDTESPKELGLFFFQCRFQKPL